MAHEAARTMAATGASLPPDDYRPGSFFKKLEPGVFWLDPSQRGEGLNLAATALALPSKPARGRTSTSACRCTRQLYKRRSKSSSSRINPEGSMTQVKPHAS